MALEKLRRDVVGHSNIALIPNVGSESYTQTLKGVNSIYNNNLAI